ncbi:MAG: class I SAM-dependent methyltransferase [Kiloniellales bacterium]
MSQTEPGKAAPSGHPHPGPTEPSPWVRRFAGRVAPGGAVLEIACGLGRHSRLFLERGHPVTAVDRDISGVKDLMEHARFEALEADLEDGRPFPLAGRRFAGVIVTNYLYQPLFPALVDAVAPGGVLIYETFARGNERFGKPRNPDHLAKPGELLDAVRGKLLVIAYEDVIDETPRPAARQRICAVNEGPELD